MCFDLFGRLIAIRPAKLWSAPLLLLGGAGGFFTRLDIGLEESRQAGRAQLFWSRRAAVGSHDPIVHDVRRPSPPSGPSCLKLLPPVAGGRLS